MGAVKDRFHEEICATAEGRDDLAEYMSSFKYLGNFSAVDPVYSIFMTCDPCRVSWTGCWDNFQCPKCGNGELPWRGNKVEGQP